MANRSQQIDILKGFCIIAVVFWHIHFTMGNYPLFPVKTILAGGGWHVSCFFIVAGFFLKEDRLIRPFSFTKQKLRTIYLKTLYFYIPAVLLHNTFISIGFYSTSADYGGKRMYLYTIADLWKKLLGAICFAGREPIVGPLWFAYVLCLALITYSIISFICARLWPKNYTNVRIIACLVLACVSAILSNKLGLTLNRLSNTLVVVGLLCGGQYLFQVKKIRFNNALCFIGALLIFWQSAVLNGNIELNNNKYNDLFHLFVGSAAMLYVLGFISLKLENTKVGFLIELAGKKSFEIMALHILSFKLVSLVLIKMGYSIDLYTNGPDTHNNILIIAAYLIIGVYLPVIAACSFDKIKNTFLKKTNYDKN